MSTCKKCYKSLTSWSKFKDMEYKEGTAYAAVGSIFNGIGHMFMGNSGYRDDCDHWSQELYFCMNCKTYHMKCPKCGNLMPLSVMPKNGKTLVKCGNCGDRTLYADDYDMGGG